MKSFLIHDLYVEITNLCAQACVHCSSCAGVRIADTISYEDLCSLVKQALPLGLKRFTLSGGEPLLHPEIIPFLRFLKQKKIQSNIYTCGVYFSSEQKIEPISDDMIQEFIHSSVQRVIFSLQGGSACVHEKISGVPGSFDITQKSINRICEAGIPVELHFVPMRLNVDDIDGVIQYASAQGIKKVSILRLVPQGRCSKDLILSYGQKRTLYEKVLVLREQYPDIEIRMGAPFNCISLAGVSCSAGQDKLLISAKGEIFPCEAFKFLRGTRPTIYQKTLQELWDNDRLLSEIRSMIGRNDSCAECEFCAFCRGGCHGQRLQENNSLLDGYDPDCILLNGGKMDGSSISLG